MPKTQTSPKKTPSQKTQKRPTRQKRQYKCFCHLKGRLRRGSDRRSLFFETSDGTLLSVDSIAREEPRNLIWLVCNMDRAMNEENYWLLYPKSLGRLLMVTPVAIIEENRLKQVQVDQLLFNASLGKAFKPGQLPLFIGRNQPPLVHHFLNLKIPEGFDMPELESRQWVEGMARREGCEFVLESLRVPGKKNEMAGR